MDIDVFHSSPVLHIGFFRNIPISHTGGLLRLDEMRRIGDGYRALHKRYPAGIAPFIVLCAGTPVAEREALQESTRFMTELRAAMLATAIVIEEGGVMAQMLTTVIRGINVVSRHRTLVVYTNHDDALRAIAPHVTKHTAGEETTVLLKQAVAEARAHWRAQDTARHT